MCRGKLREETEHHKTVSYFRSSVQDLKVFGPGHMLYFSFLRSNALLFLGLALCVGLPQVRLRLCNALISRKLRAVSPGARLEVPEVLPVGRFSLLWV